MVVYSLIIHCSNMFLCLLSRHVSSLWFLLGVLSFPTIILVLKVSSVTQAQVYYTTGNNIQIPNFLMPTTITVNIPQGAPPTLPAPPTSPRPAAPPATFGPIPGVPPSAPGAPPASGAPAPFTATAPARTPAPAPPQQPQTISVSITQPQQVVSSAVDSCVGMGCYSLIPLAPVAQPVVYTQPLYYSLGWRNWAFGWRTGWSGCSWFC